MKRYGNFAALPLMAALCLLIGGCEREEDLSNGTDTTASAGETDRIPLPFFPTQPEPQTEAMQALLTGKLVVEGDCLRVGEHLLIWPYGFTVRDDNGVVEVRDETGGTVAHVGEEVKLGGGQVGELSGDLAPIAEHGCDGPYWIVGEVVGNVVE